MENPQKQSLAIPIAIVLAGAIISFGLYMSNKPASTTVVTDTNTGTNNTREINVPPVTSNDNIIGSTNADIVLVEYSDTECPFCKNFHNTLHQLKTEYAPSNKLAWVYRQFPIVQLHAKAPKESEATLCAADQGKFWPYIDRVFEITTSNDGLPTSALPEIAAYVGMDVTAFNTCLSSGKHTAAVDASVKEAQQLGANGTPTSFLLLKKGECSIVSLPVESKDIDMIKVALSDLINSVWSGKIMSSSCENPDCTYCPITRSMIPFIKS